MTPNYYGIITASIRYSKELKDFEKLLYSDITALSNLHGYCTATNEYFADLFGKSKGTISKAIGNLHRLGHLKVVIIYEKGTKHIIGRRIYPLNKQDDTVRNINHEAKEEKPKEAQKKSISDIVLPDWLDKDAWAEWVKYRSERRSPLTPMTVSKQLKLLEKYKPIHRKIIEQSITNGWTGLFEIKANTPNRKEPEVGSIAWYAQQEQAMRESTIDVTPEE